MRFFRLEFAGFSGKPDTDVKHGFTIAGPIYTLTDEYVKLCASQSIPVIITLKVKIDFLDEKTNFDPSDVQAQLKVQIEKYLSFNPNIYGWYLLPEELRPWRSIEMSFLKTCSDFIKQYNDKPLFSYNPFNRDSFLLGRMVTNGLDFVARNAYVTFDVTANRAKIVDSMNDCVKCFEELATVEKKSRCLIGVYLQLAVDPLDLHDDQLIPTMVRHDMFLSVLFGAQAVLLWSLFKRASVLRTFDLQYKSYAETIQEINSTTFSLNGRDVTLAQIMLNGSEFEKELEQDTSGTRYFSRGVYKLGEDNTRLVVEINSTSETQCDDKGTSFSPFEVKYTILKGN
jgi:hypothetical protein